MARSSLKIIRFTRKEETLIGQFLSANPGFGSVSSLGRVAILDFICNRYSLKIHPVVSGRGSASRPSFLWEYDLSREQVHELLRHAPFEKKKWLLARILEEAPFQEVLDYLDLETIASALPHLRLDPKKKAHWEKALSVWQS